MLHVGLGHALVESCGVKIAIKAKQRGQFLRIRFFAKRDEVVPLRFEAIIPLVLVLLSDNRDFLFHPTAKPA